MLRILRHARTAITAAASVGRVHPSWPARALVCARCSVSCSLGFTPLRVTSPFHTATAPESDQVHSENTAAAEAVSPDVALLRTIAAAGRSHPRALELLLVTSYCAPDPDRIPYTLLEAVFRALEHKETPASNSATPSQSVPSSAVGESFADCCAVLIQSGLVLPDGEDSIRVQRHVQQAVRASGSKIIGVGSSESEWLARVGGVLADGLSASRASRGQQNDLQRVQWLPHARSILAHFTEEDTRPTHMAVLDALLFNIACTDLYLLREPQVAIPNLQRLITLRMRFLGPENLEVGTALHDLACAHGMLGDNVRMHELLEQSLSIQMNAFGADSPKLSNVLGDLGTVCMEIGELDRAAELQEQCLVLSEKRFGVDSYEVSTSLLNLATVCYKRGESDRALQLLERALMLRERCFGPDHPEVAQVLINRATILSATDQQYELAFDLFDRGQRIMHACYGADHPESVHVHMCRAIAYGDRGDHEQKRKLIEQLLANLEKVGGPPHPQLPSALCALGAACREMGDHARAVQVLQQALGLLQDLYGSDDHPELVTPMSQLALAHESLGEWDRSRSLLERCLVIRERQFGAQHPSLQWMVDHLAQVCDKIGDDARAAQLREWSEDIKAHTVSTATIKDKGASTAPNGGDN